jgi:hypothetical protein
MKKIAVHAAPVEPRSDRAMNTIINGTIAGFVFLDVDEMLHAITYDKTGANLPPLRGRWKFQTAIAVGIKQPMPHGIDPNRALNSLRENGYFIWPANDILLLTMAVRQFSKTLCDESRENQAICFGGQSTVELALGKLRQLYRNANLVSEEIVRSVDRRYRLTAWPLPARWQPIPRMLQILSPVKMRSYYLRWIQPPAPPRS